jgi:hypothetical protein
MSDPRDGLPPANCPTCDYHMDAATPAGDDEDVRPKSGDFSLCLNCGEALRFDEALRLVAVKPGELADLDDAGWRQIWRGQQLIRARGPIRRG